MNIKYFIKKILTSYYKLKFGKFGHRSYVSPKGSYLSPKQIFIGDDVYIGEGAIISANKGMVIGSGVIIGPQLMVMGGDHNFRKVGFRIHECQAGGVNEPIIIEDDVWIGARVLILKGVKISEGAIIGAGSVVTRNVPPYSISAGNPAKKIGMRFNQQELMDHLKIIKSNYTIDDIMCIK
jgi:acetyltransferase-like isoleucine patch superfamily enzyme